MSAAAQLTNDHPMGIGSRARAWAVSLTARSLVASDSSAFLPALSTAATPGRTDRSQPPPVAQAPVAATAKVVSQHTRAAVITQAHLASHQAHRLWQATMMRAPMPFRSRKG